MPRESTRPFVSGDHAPHHPDRLQIRIDQNERTVRVALSGILDREGVDRLVSRVAPRLVSRGCRVILEGKSEELVNDPLARKHYLGDDFKM